ncbi:hypothetical protein [Streptomyces hainanensis]|uniref:Uncharacterized protein n=1 Tax=Streptomyces hainanensis TaxID=402648 RepID=A0A4R4TFC1_9ACTN|nr:hypothetical protein [Streptomyces hainanensis]TDC73613.1 hypothetical protein E1283_18745 [Streptomyces hainanensis]
MVCVFGDGSGRDLDLSNGGTTVLVEVLTLAVAELAREPWHFRFAMLVATQDQSIMGRGVVGFHLTEIDWGTTGAARGANQRFVLDVIALAAARHRWRELRYDPPHAPAYLAAYAEIVRGFDPATARPDPEVFPGPDGGAVASCARHRVLTAWPHWDGCVFCHRTQGLAGTLNRAPAPGW